MTAVWLNIHQNVCSSWNCKVGNLHGQNDLYIYRQSWQRNFGRTDTAIKAVYNKSISKTWAVLWHFRNRRNNKHQDRQNKSRRLLHCCIRLKRVTLKKNSGFRNRRHNSIIVFTFHDLIHFTFWQKFRQLEKSNKPITWPLPIAWLDIEAK